MSLCMYQAGYTSESITRLIEDPQDRIETVRQAFEDMGAEIVAGGYPIGEYDVLVVYKAPDDATGPWPGPWPPRAVRAAKPPRRGSQPTRPDISERQLPISHADGGPHDIKLRDDPSVTLDCGNSATFNWVDGTCTPGILVIAAAILVALVAANGAR